MAGVGAIIGALIFAGNRSAAGRFDPPVVNDTGRSWRATDTRTTNVSHYVYRDVNRNGSYDEADFPMPGIAVRVRRPDGTSVIKTSNLRGFANFTNSLIESPVDVYQAGLHSFQVLAPEAWSVTSGNGYQEIQYRAAAQTRPGVIAEQIPPPVGLAPVLTIDGRVVSRQGGRLVPAPSARVTVTYPSGLRSSVRIAPHGRFRVQSTEGRVLIEAVSVDRGRAARREVDVSTVAVQLSALVLGETGLPPDRRRTVDFEQFDSAPITKIPNGPAGLRWRNLIAVANDLYGGAGYVNATTSGSRVAYNTSGYPVEISSDDAFAFVGGHFGVGWPIAEGETLSIEAWRGDRLVGAEEVYLSAMGPVWFDANYTELTRLVLSTKHYWQFVADDLLFAFDSEQ